MEYYDIKKELPEMPDFMISFINESITKLNCQVVSINRLSDTATVIELDNEGSIKCYIEDNGFCHFIVHSHVEGCSLDYVVGHKSINGDDTVFLDGEVTDYDKGIYLVGCFPQAFSTDGQFSHELNVEYYSPGIVSSLGGSPFYLTFRKTADFRKAPRTLVKHVRYGEDCSFDDCISDAISNVIDVYNKEKDDIVKLIK